ncbi:MAG: hypothetical protein VKJ04_02065 [Vampirovibrionales bacterium]|nr:hypothetical protein [Vampirovibrionales bacterium]
MPVSLLNPLFWLQPLLFAGLGFCLSYGLLWWLFSTGYPRVERFILNRFFTGDTKTRKLFQEKLLTFCEEQLPKTIEQWSHAYFKNLDAKGRKQIVESMSTIYDRVFPLLRLEYHQSEVMMDVVFSTFLTPKTIRAMAIEGLMSLPAERIETAIKQSLSGWSGLIGRFVDLKPVIEQMKLDLINKPELGTDLIIKAIDQMEVREKLAEGMSKLDWQRLDKNERAAICDWLNQFVDEWLQDDPNTLAMLVSSVLTSASRMLMALFLKTNWQQLTQAVSIPYIDQRKRQQICLAMLRPLLVKISLFPMIFGFLMGLLSNCLAPMIFGVL